MAKGKDYHISTKAIHVGNEPDPATGAVIPPIFQTSTYVQSSPGKHLGYEYTRSHNPTRTRLEDCLASLENAKYCKTTSSGLSAAMLIMHLLPKGSHILCGDDVYGGTYRLFSTIFNTHHHFHFIDTTDLKQVKSMMNDYKPKLIWLETPTNPMMKVSDISKIVKVAKDVRCQVLVDNTFATPFHQNPLSLGADYVLHSMTKYLNGHSDAVAGCIMTNSKPADEKLFALQNSIGPSLSPFDSWLVLRGLKTFGIRMERHAANGMKVAKFLEGHKKISKVYYPGLKSHAGHAIAKKQMTNGFGGMISFQIKGGLREAKAFFRKSKLFKLAESLGGVESLSEHPAIMTHASVPKDIRENLGITDSLVRISVGIEDINDLIQDIDNAL